MREKFGDINSLKKLGENKKNTFVKEQLLDSNLKNLNGENRKEVEKRMRESFNKVCIKNYGKKVAIVSHGAAIKFLLMNWCKLNENYELEYEEKEIKVESPSVIKIVIEDVKLKELLRIY